MSLPAALDAKEQVRQAVDIVDLIGQYIPLRRQGRNFVGRCPWHDDSRPSLHINPERQIFRCWVCEIGGDIFSFVMRVEGLEFRQALEMLAERAGISLQLTSPGSAGHQPPGGAGDKRTLFGAMAWAEEQFHRCLLESPEAEPARMYLAERGIRDESVRRFRLGFSPDQWEWLLRRARDAGWTVPVLERVGLVRRRQSGEGVYDYFRGRLLFSIRDAQRRPIAFGARVLPQLADEHPGGGKYINSPETPLFAKSRELYGLDLARDEIVKTRQVIVMEGYTDCLMAHQNGIQNAVAVLGTALGERHLPVLRRFSDSITLVLDGDEAGRRRTNEILELFVAHQIDLRILALPEGADPCDFIASQGSEAFQRLLETAVDALEHKLRMESNGLDVYSQTHRTTAAAELVLSTLARARPGAGVTTSAMLLREQQMLTRTARHFQLPEEGLRRRLVEFRRRDQRKPLAQPRRPNIQTPTETEHNPRHDCPADWPAWDRELLELVLLDAAHMPTIAQAIEPPALSAPLARLLFEQSLQLWRDGQDRLFEGLMVRNEDAHVKSVLVELDERGQAKKSSDTAMWLDDLLRVHQRRAEMQRRSQPPPNGRDQSADDQLLAQFIHDNRPQHLKQLERRNQ